MCGQGLSISLETPRKIPLPASLRVLAESSSYGLSCSFGCWLVTRGLKPSGSWQPHQVSPFPLRPAIVGQSFSCCKRIFHNSIAHSYDWIGPTQAIQENFPILRFIYLPVSAKSLWQCNFTYFHILDTRL